MKPEVSDEQQASRSTHDTVDIQTEEDWVKTTYFEVKEELPRALAEESGRECQSPVKMLPRVELAQKMATVILDHPRLAALKGLQNGELVLSEPPGEKML